MQEINAISQRLRPAPPPFRVAVYATLVSATLGMAFGIVAFTVFSQKIITGAPLSMG